MHDFHEAATRHLANIDDDWARLIDQVGPSLHAPKPAREPYEALIRAIAYQQLHARAGDAILARMLALYPDSQFPAPEQILSTGIDTFRRCGFSARKIDTIRTIAESTLSGVVPERRIADEMPDEVLIERLVSLPGIGRWTVEMLLIYTLERLDILPADDFGLREGYRRLKSLETAPNPKQLARLAEHWHPYRTIASWYLWRIPR